MQPTPINSNKSLTYTFCHDHPKSSMVLTACAVILLAGVALAILAGTTSYVPPYSIGIGSATAATSLVCILSVLFYLRKKAPPNTPFPKPLSNHSDPKGPLPVKSQSKNPPKKEQKENDQPPSWAVLPINQEDLQQFEISPPIPTLQIPNNIEYVKIEESPYDRWGFGTDFRDEPLYYNAPHSLFRPTPLRSIMIIRGQDGQHYQCTVTKAIDLRNADQRVNHWAWVMVDRPVLANNSDTLTTLLHANWWQGKVSPGLAGDLFYDPGFVQTLFPAYTGNATQGEYIRVHVDRETGNLYLLSKNKERLYFACPPDAIFVNSEVKTIEATFGIFTVETDKITVKGKPAWVITQKPQPDHLKASL